jgi:PBP1b-binding outer membrane lipoprotein LpoB
MRLSWLAGAQILVAAGILAGCSSDPPAEQNTTTESETAPTGHGSLAQCLSEHGVPSAPGPAAGPPPGVDPATWQRAMQTCSSLAPGPAG